MKIRVYAKPRRGRLTSAFEIQQTMQKVLTVSQMALRFQLVMLSHLLVLQFTSQAQHLEHQQYSIHSMHVSRQVVAGRTSSCKLAGNAESATNASRWLPGLHAVLHKHSTLSPPCCIQYLLVPRVSPL